MQRDRQDHRPCPQEGEVKQEKENTMKLFFVILAFAICQAFGRVGFIEQRRKKMIRKCKCFGLVVSLILAVVSLAGQDEYQAKCKRCGGKGTVSVKETCKKCGGRGYYKRERVTKYRSTFAGTNVRRFNDGQAGTVPFSCDECSRKGYILDRKVCPACNGMKTVSASIERSSEAKNVESKNQNQIKVDPDLELARQRLNTGPFKSYRCNYREECPHCKKLFEMNQLTKSYCEQCFVCKKKRNADDDGKQADEIKALEKAVKKAVEARREERSLFE